MRRWSKIYTGDTSRYSFDAQAFSDMINDIGGNMSDNAGSYAGLSIKVTPKGTTHAVISLGIGESYIDLPSSVMSEIFTTNVINSNSIEFSCFICGEEGGNVSIRSFSSVTTSGYGLFISKSPNTVWAAGVVYGSTKSVYVKDGIVINDAPKPVIDVHTNNYNPETTNDLVLVPYIVNNMDGEIIKDAFVTATTQNIGDSITLSGKHLVSSRIHNVIGYIVDTIENVEVEINV